MAGPGQVGKRKKTVDYSRVEVLASYNLTNQEIYSILGVSNEWWYRNIQTDPKLAHALERGRALRTYELARKLIKKSEASDADWRMQLEILKRVGPRWKEAPLIEQNIQAQNVQVQTTMSEETQIRVAAAFLRSKGIEVEIE